MNKELIEYTNLQIKNINNVDNVESIIIIKNDINNYIYFLNNHIKELEKLVNLIDDKLIKKCNHDWIIDHTNLGEHTEYICSTCSLYR